MRTDFPPATPAEAEEERSKAIAKLLEHGLTEEEEEDEGEVDDIDEAAQGWGVHALPLDYTPLGPYVEKAQNITSFEREGKCVVCHQNLEHDKGLYAICSNAGCEGVGHLVCWSRHLLNQKGEADDNGVLLPMEGHCPTCRGAVKWGDMMKELTLRTRGQKEVEQLLKRRRKAARVTASKAKVKSPEKVKAPAKTKAPAREKTKAIR